MTGPSLKHRADIDGLRAVSVLLVIIYHAFPQSIRGGFVGVDIFFVISGYLIGGILIKGIDAGTFSFTEFYARRIRRIFPALAIVLAFCLALGWRVLLADEYKSLAEQAGSGALFFANILLWAQTGYFDADATLKPLLHLWSLGVEEQFYIIWPPVLLLAYRLRWNLILVAAGLAALSFALNVDMIHTDVAGAFFLPQTRIWEPMVGCLLAYFAYHQGEQLEAHLPNVKACGGALLIAIAAVKLNGTDLFPGWGALLPTLGAVLVIWAGPKALLNRYFLSHPVMVWIGLISYPLYLWHWPLLSFAKICSGQTPTAMERLALLGASFALAALTYLLVEKRIRYRRSVAVPAVLAAAMLFVASASFATYRENGYPHRVERFVRLEAQLGQWDYPSGDMKVTQFEGIPVRERDSHIPKKVLFIGDSNMEMYWPRIQQLINIEPDKVKSVVFVTNAGCLPILGVEDRMHSNCNGWIEKAVRYAHTENFDTVVVDSNWLGYFSWGRTYTITQGVSTVKLTTREGLRRGMAALQAMLEGFQRDGKKVVLVLNIPNSPKLYARNLIGRSLAGFRIEEGGIERTSLNRWYAPIHAGLLQVAHNADVTVIDPMDSLCPNGFCPAWYGDGGDPIYKDGDHLSAAYVREHATFIDQTIASTQNLIDAAAR